MLACAQPAVFKRPRHQPPGAVPGAGVIVVTSIGVKGGSVTRIKRVPASCAPAPIISTPSSGCSSTSASTSPSSSSSSSSSSPSASLPKPPNSKAPSKPADESHELPGGGVSLTLAELQDMAVRQQQQLQVQHQLLSAREQRLHFLKHGGQPGGQAGQADSERLRRLRERVEAQEQKLRKLRALRGQVDSNKLSNAALTSDLDSIRALFNEKEKELSLAVAKVEELTHQLEELRRGRQNAMTGQLPASMELDKLRRELMYRNKLNEQQNMQISHQRETLCQRQEEVNEIDRRISELQERLHRKRLLNQQLANQLSVANNKAVSNSAVNQQNLRSSLSTGAGQHHQQKYQDQQKLLTNSVKGYSKQSLHRPTDPYNLISNNNNCNDTSTDSEKSLKNLTVQSAQGPVPVNAYLITSSQGQKAQSSSSSSSDETHSPHQLQKISSLESQQQELRFGASQDDFHMKLLHQKQAARFPSQNVNNNVNCLNNNNLTSSINNNVSIKNNTVQAAILSKHSTCNDEKDDYPIEFSGSKSDPKYQTLPYKFSPNSIQTPTPPSLNSPVAISSKTQKSDSGPISDEISKGISSNSMARGVLTSQNSGSKSSSADLMSQLQPSLAKMVLNTSTSSSSVNLQPRVYGSGSIPPRGQPVGGVSSTSSSTITPTSSMNNNSLSSTTSSVISSSSSSSSSHQVGNVSIANAAPESTTASWAARAALGSLSSSIVTAAPSNFNHSPTSATTAVSPPSSTNKASSHPTLTPTLMTSAILAPAKLDSLSQLTRLPVEAGSVVLPPTPLTLANQKPVSSVAPTSVQHQKPSPIYQTSSTKIHPIQPQILSSTPQGVLKDVKGEMSPPQSSSTPLSTPDVPSDRATVGKPALPPKPAVPIKPTPPPRQTQHISQYLEGSSGWINDPRLINPSWNVNTQSSENLRPAVEISSEVTDNNSLRGSISISTRGSISQAVYSQSQTQNQQSLSQSDCINQNSSNFHQALQQDCPLQDSQHEDDDSNSSTVSPPPPPTTEPPEEVTSFSWRSNNESQSTKTKSATVKKHSNIEVSKHQNISGISNLNSMSMLNNNVTSSNINNINNNNNNSSNGNSMHVVSLSRRIEMPPAFLFPENETPPADLIATRDENRTTCLSSNDTAPGKDETDRIMPLGGSDSNTNEDTKRQLHISDDTIKCSSNVNDIETMNNLNTSGPQNDDSQPLITETKGDSPPLHILRRTNKKGNLKSGKISVSGSGSRRVSFDPLALLLDASLEGELELVRKTAGQVSNPSAANDEGITALHNAICAGHLEIVKFLVEFGCDVNAQDSDGWTPLHCAASCNNLAMVRFLVEHGACIFATTLSDHETAAEKCEEDEEGFDGCSEYLYSVQEKLGILNNGVVYAVFDYDAHNSDELSFHEGNKLVVLRKGDEWEREWWWSRLNDQEGYIPRNLLGLYPRVQPKRNIE